MELERYGIAHGDLDNQHTERYIKTFKKQLERSCRKSDKKKSKCLKVIKDLWISILIRMWSSCKIIFKNKNVKTPFQVYDKNHFGNMGWKQKDSPVLVMNDKVRNNSEKLVKKLVPYLGKENIIEDLTSYQRVTYQSKGKNKYRYELKWRTYKNVLSQI
jgi:hypothetical protein